MSAHMPNALAMSAHMPTHSTFSVFRQFLHILKFKFFFKHISEIFMIKYIEIIYDYVYVLRWMHGGAHAIVSKLSCLKMIYFALTWMFVIERSLPFYIPY